MVRRYKVLISSGMARAMLKSEWKDGSIIYSFDLLGKLIEISKSKHDDFIYVNMEQIRYFCHFLQNYCLWVGNKRGKHFCFAFARLRFYCNHISLEEIWSRYKRSGDTLSATMIKYFKCRFRMHEYFE